MKLHRGWWGEGEMCKRERFDPSGCGEGPVGPLSVLRGLGPGSLFVGGSGWGGHFSVHAGAGGGGGGIEQYHRRGLGVCCCMGRLACYLQY